MTRTRFGHLPPGYISKDGGAIWDGLEWHALAALSKREFRDIQRQCKALRWYTEVYLPAHAARERREREKRNAMLDREILAAYGNGDDTDA